MSSPFQLIGQTLEAEGVLANSDLARLVPEQVHIEEHGDLSMKMKTLWVARGWKNKKVLLFVDGVEKVWGTSQIADDVVQRALESTSASVTRIDVSKLLKTTDIHASVVHMPVLREFVRAHSECVFFVLCSGTLTDLVKHALFLENSHAPFVVAPTALTVTAFTSSFAVLDEGGAKRTRPSRVVDVTIWCDDVVKAAPIAMSRAGYGDLLARFVAYADWYVGHVIKIADRYDELAFRLMESFSKPIQDAAQGFQGHSIENKALANLSAALAMAGIAMSVSGETTPLSGFEHTISHALDFLRLTSHREMVLHGEQVGLATLASARCWDVFANEEFPKEEFKPARPEQMRKLIKRLIDGAPLFGYDEAAMAAAQQKPDFVQKLNEASETFAVDYLKKYEKWVSVAPHFESVRQNWSDVQKEIKRLTLPSERIEELLRLSGLPLECEATAPMTTAIEYRWAVRFSPFVRTRFCISDLMFWYGMDPAALAAI